VKPTPVPTDEFYFPVDSAVCVETPALGVPKLMNVHVRTQDGELVADNADREDRSLPPGAYTVELSAHHLGIRFEVVRNLATWRGVCNVHSWLRLHPALNLFKKSR
jgi:hypothetical protein